MAENSRDELNNRREQSKVEKEINNIISSRERAYKESVKSAGDALDLSRQITEDIKDQLGMVRAKSEADTGALSLARKLQQSAQAVTTELGNQGKIQRQLINDQNLLSSIRTEISNIDKKIGDQNSDTARRIAQSLTKQQELLVEQEEIRNTLAYLSGDERKAADKKLKQLQQQLNTAEAIVKTAEAELAKQGDYQAGDIRRYIQLKQQEELGEKLLQQRNAELNIQRQIEDHTGVTGALVEGVGGIMQRLGMRSGIFQNAMALAAEDMKNMSEETIRTQKAIEEAEAAMEGLQEGTAEYVEAQKKLDIAKQGKQFDKVQIALAGATQLSKGFGKALLDPLTIVLAIVDGFFKVDKAATDLQQITGQNSNSLAGFNSRLASSVDVLETMAELTRQTGMNAQNIFSPDVLAGAAELKNTMGLAADEAGGLAMIAQTTSGNIDAVTESIVNTTSEFNAANRSAVSQGQILRDVAKASDGIKASLSGNPKAIAQAASAARRLGMELNQVDSIASSLMDFESSIEAELEAQLLTGKNINMAKARELALNNDLAGLSKELFKNSSDITEFGKMNRIQQEAQAKALGMTRDELAKIAYNRALENNMTKEQAAAAAGVKKEDMERMAVQEKLAKAAEKLAQAFSPMLDILIPIADLVGFIAKYITLPISALFSLIDLIKQGEENTSGWRNVLAGIVKLLAGGTVLLVLKSLRDAFKTGGIKNYFSILKSNFKNAGKLAGGFKDKLKEAFTGKAGKITDDIKSKAKDKLKDSITDKGGDKVGDLSKKTSEAAKNEPKSAGKNIREFLKNLGKGIKSFGKNATVKDIAKIALAGAGFLVFTLAAPGLAVVALLGTPAGIGLTALGKGMAAFGRSMQALGPQGLGYAAAGIGLLTIALLGAGYALKLAAPGFEALGKAIKSAFEGVGTIITAAGDAITKILDAITLENVAALFALGPALISAGAGLVSFSVMSLMALPGLGVLSAIASMANPLATVGSSLAAITAGIGAMAAALNSLETEKLEELKSLVMATAFAAPMVAASGAITSLIQGIAGGGEGETSNADVVAKIDELISVVKQGGTINMDGNKVGQYIMLSANKSA